MKFSKGKRAKVFLKTKGRCSYCGCVLDRWLFQVEHLNPKIRGGGNEIENLWPSCRSCNAGKKSKTIEEFRVWYQFKNLTGMNFTMKQIEALKKKGAFGVIGVDESRPFYFESMGE